MYDQPTILTKPPSRPTSRPSRLCWARSSSIPTPWWRSPSCSAADDFHLQRHGWIYQAILDLNGKNTKADFLTVTDELERRRQLDEAGGPAYVMDLINAVPTAIHADALRPHRRGARGGPPAAARGRPDRPVWSTKSRASTGSAPALWSWWRRPSSARASAGPRR